MCYLLPDPSQSPSLLSESRTCTIQFKWVHLYTGFNKSNAMQGSVLLFDVKTVTTIITQLIVKEVCVDYLGYVSTVPSTFICSHVQIPAPNNNTEKETISCGYPALRPWTDCSRPSFLRDLSGWTLEAIVEFTSNDWRFPNLTTPPCIRLRCAPS